MSHELLCLVTLFGTNTEYVLSITLVHTGKVTGLLILGKYVPDNPVSQYIDFRCSLITVAHTAC